MPQSVSYLWQRTLRQSASAEEPPFVRIDPTPRLREHTDVPRRTLRFAASMLAKTPRLPARIFRFRSLSRRSLPGTIRRKSRMTCTSSKQACVNKATNCSFGRFKITVTHLTRSLQRSSSAWTAWQKSTLRLHLPPTPELDGKRQAD